MSRLRLASALVWAGPLASEGRLEMALALMASALPRLALYKPTLLPFGYAGPKLRLNHWVERSALENVAKQIVGLTQGCVCPTSIASVVEHGVDQAIRLGFLEQKSYDAWRPGMRSGSGWRRVVAATPYGVMKAHRLAKSAESVEAPRPQVSAEVMRSTLARQQTRQPRRGRRAANIERLEKELEKHLLAARDHAHALRDSKREPNLLPRPSQKELAQRTGLSQSDVSRCLRDPRARILKILWETADSLESVLHYKRS